MPVDPDKLDKLKAVKEERAHIIREQWVKVMELRIIREQLDKCQKAEGINHYENCKEWSERYLKLLPEAKITGWKRVEKYKPAE